ncbi:mycofactocin biosynthesis peptidyl-dipeptidase MftE [Tomitella cavernea]|uniref:Mycofactocin biosynthesis peptidyl-dipeptidase MftE n=1 Tax=Tomitella cavernea TaxID=1387982 RepID=A0ABP9CGC6_9ACTN|nr:mycofactocin biosynthesis peptidyl-dipeptidase MftE [Tomitella cavernea]
MNLADSTWAETAADLLVVPVGSVEQHGPHLPLDTDTRIATAVAVSLDEVVAPALAYGASGEHEQFPGTVSIGSEALRLLLVEYGRSACRWARRVVFVNGHGGNASALASAVKLLRYEGRDAAWWTPVIPDGDAHAGRTETAVMLHLAPGSVRMRAAAPGNTAPAGALWQAMREGGVAAVSVSGVLGDPTGATADEGKRIVEVLCAELRAAVDAWSPDGHGRIAA